MDPYYLLLTDGNVSASIYGLLAIGISIIWSSLGMINMAQGFTFTVAGYGAWLAAQNISTNGFVVVAGGVMTGALAGALIGGIAFIPLYDKPNFPLRSLIATLAISLMGGQVPALGVRAAGEGAAEDLRRRQLFISVRQLRATTRSARSSVRRFCCC